MTKAIPDGFALLVLALASQGVSSKYSQIVFLEDAQGLATRFYSPAYRDLQVLSIDTYNPEGDTISSHFTRDSIISITVRS